MVQYGIVLGHEISRKGIEVDKAKIEVIAKLPTPKCVKDLCSFLEHAGFYRRFIKNFSKIARLLTSLLAKDVPFIFDDILMPKKGQNRTYLCAHNFCLGLVQTI